jgi:predicted permease
MTRLNAMLEQGVRDLRLAARGLLRARAFTATAVLTLALGIGATTVMFALVHGVLLRPQPIREQERLIVAWKAYPAGGFDYWPFSKADIEVVARESRLFEQVGGLSRHGAWPGVAVEPDAASPVNTTCVTGSFFATLGVAPILGRGLEPADDVVGAEKVLVISHALWQRRYGGAPDVIGRRLALGDPPFRIVGVMPPELDYPVGVEAWMTIEAQVSLTGPLREAVRQENVLLARLRPGVTREQARQELQALVARLETAAGDRRELVAVVRSFDDVVVGDVRPAMLVLLGAVCLLLLIASANTANLMLVRGEARRSELAVRAALGASGAALARQLLAESLLIALAAGLCGLLAARAALPLVLALVPGGLPRLEAVQINAAVVFFTAALAFVSAALAGVMPALFAARTDVAFRLRTGRFHGAGDAGRGRRALVVAQVALAVAVVAAAGLLTRSLMRLQRVGMGLDADRLVVATLAFSPAGEKESPLPADFHDEVVTRLRGIPGVESATPVNNPPLAGVSGWDSPQSMAEGQTADVARSNPSLNLEAVYPEHFKTLGVPMGRGRAFTPDDGPTAPPVAVVSADVAQRLWPNQDPIGRRIRIGVEDSGEPWARWRTVVGVVQPIRYRDLAVTRPTLYLPAVQFIETPQAYLMRTSVPAAALAGIVRERVEAAHSRTRVMAVAPFRQYLQVPLARPRFNAFVIALFAGASLLLAAVGLYAVMAAAVRQRQQEIGIRVAVGATARDVRGLVLGEALRLAAAGAAIGVALSIAGARLVRGLLFSVHPLDPLSLLGAAALLVAVCAFACVWPVRYATKVDALVALRAG